MTEELRKMIVGNKLEVIASNEIKGDPDEGTVKKLTIEYRFGGITVTKEFTEGEEIEGRQNMTANQPIQWIGYAPVTDPQHVEAVGKVN